MRIAALHAELEHLALEELAPDFVAVLDLAEARARLRLAEEVGQREALRRGDVLEGAVDPSARDVTWAFSAACVLELLVDHLVDAGPSASALGGRLVGAGRHLLLDLEEERPRPVLELGEEDGLVADDRRRRARRRRRAPRGVGHGGSERQRESCDERADAKHRGASTTRRIAWIHAELSRARDARPLRAKGRAGRWRASWRNSPTPRAASRSRCPATARFSVPDHPIVPFIEGDGTGPDIWRASQRVFDAAVEKAYGGKKKIAWYEVFAGEKAFKAQFDNWLPDETVDAYRKYLVGIKGPLTTPIGKGIRSLNVALRQMLDLYVCLRPVRWFKGVPSPGQGSRRRRHGDLPREHRRHLRRHRVGGRERRGQEGHRLPPERDEA